MDNSETTIAGIPIPSTSHIFLSVVGFHVLLGLACAITGIITMLSAKGRGRHSSFGTTYYWCLLAVFISAASLSAVRWSDDYHLFVLGALSFTAAHWGRRALRQRWRKWPLLHVSGMGTSYILLLTAFYVDNGKNLPLWKALPQIAFWLLPSVIGAPIILYVLWRHPVIRRTNINS
jgi:hypothetical protein